MPRHQGNAEKYREPCTNRSGIQASPNLETRGPAMSIEPVLVGVFADNGDTFDLSLSRVPCVDELVDKEGKCYRVFGVHHSSLNTEGKAFAGNHAYLSVQALEVEPPVPGEDFRKKLSRARMREVKRKAKSRRRTKYRK